MTRYAGAMRRVVVLGVIAAALAAPAAHAARPAAGRWVATFSSLASTRMTFSVDPGSRRVAHVVVRGFLVYCTSTDDSSFDTWPFPPLAISAGGAFAGVHRTRVGSTTQKYTLRGRFSSATSASGYADEQSAGGYCVGGSKWRARRR